MKKILLAAIILLSFSCKSKKSNVGNTDSKYDSIALNPKQKILVDSLLSEVSTLDSIDCEIKILQVSDSFRNIIRTKDSALFESNFKLVRVWYYDSLCLKNSKLEIYLTGWVRRALEK